MTTALGGVYPDEAEFKRRHVRLVFRMPKAGVTELLGSPLSMGTGFSGGEGSKERSPGEWWIYAVQQQDGRLFYVLRFDDRGELTGTCLEPPSRHIETRKAQGRARPLVGLYASVERLVELVSAVNVGSSQQHVEERLGLPYDAQFVSPMGGGAPQEPSVGYWLYAGGAPFVKLWCSICFDSRRRVVSKHMASAD